MNNYDTNDIIYAPATASGGAIAVIRVSGESCISRLSDSVKCSKGLISYNSGSAVFGRLYDKCENLLDECVFTVYKDGHGYTGEESVEISCHGGSETVRCVTEHLATLGFRLASRGEFTLRAFLHGKMDLTQAEAVNELIKSRTSESRINALGRLDGALSNRINDIKNTVVGIMGKVEVQLDYSDDEIGEEIEFPFEDLKQAMNMLSEIIKTYRVGRLYSKGARIVLYGAVNAGKSSLFNLFLRENRAIVSPVAGTTRDYIEGQCSIGGIPVVLFDTAGIRDADCEIEAEGVRRSIDLVSEADVIIYVCDALDPVFDDSVLYDSRTIAVINKADLSSVSKEGFISVSALNGNGFEDLCNAIALKLKGSECLSAYDNLIIENDRQKADLERAYKSLETAYNSQKNGVGLEITAMELQDCIQALGQITGEVTTDDILDRIFSDFCVGK